MAASVRPGGPWKAEAVAQVDPDDDTRERWIVYCYRFDPARHERRHCVLAAYDTEQEMWRRMSDEADELAARKRVGLAGLAEHLTGAHKEAGHKLRADEARLARKLFVLRSKASLRDRP